MTPSVDSSPFSFSYFFNDSLSIPDFSQDTSDADILSKNTGDATSILLVLRRHLNKTNTTLSPVNTINEIFNQAERPPTRYDFPSPYSSECRILFTIMYTLLTIISVCGNSTVCYVVLRNKRMRTVTNFFLANQAMSDVIMTFFNIPFIVTKEMTRSWPFGLVACHFVDFVGVLSVYVSTFTLTAIAVDRHRVIVHPLKPRITMATAILITVFIWALSVTLSLPYLIWKDLIGLTEVDPTLVVCFASFPKPTELYKHLLTYTTLLLQYVIPLVIISTSYVSIGHKLWSRTAVGDVIESQQAANARMKIRTTRMLVAVVAVFSICWLPIQVYLLVTFYHNSLKHDFVYLCFHWFAMLSVCISPIAFCLLNENFRNDIKTAIGRLTTKLFRKTPNKVTRANMEDGVGGTKSQDTFANTMSKDIHTLSEDIALTKSTTAGKYTTTPTTQATGKIIKLVVPIATIDVSEA